MLGQSTSGDLGESLDRLERFMRQERKLLLAIFLYAIVVGVFSLIIPLTVQELVNTFAFSVQPIMVVTLVTIMAGILVFVSVFRALQFYATEILERRIFVRISLALARKLPWFKEKDFRPEYVSRFFETVFMQRAISSLLVDLMNVIVGGFIGMTLLALYHPYFLVFDLFLLVSVGFIGFLGRGGLQATLTLSKAKYKTFHWFQVVANNINHFKVTNSTDLVLKKTDALASEYVWARDGRFRVLIRQFIGSLAVQVILHTGLLGTAGWLLSRGELTLGQLVAAEVIVATLLVNLDSVVKRMYAVFYFLTALTELDYLFTLPQDPKSMPLTLSIPRTNQYGVALSCSQINGLPAPWPIAKELNFAIGPGEKYALLCATESQKHIISRLISGMEVPSVGAVRYNEIDVRNINPEEINSLRGLVFSRELNLFEGTFAENITMGRTEIKAEDLLWAIHLVQLENEIEHLPEGLNTIIDSATKEFSSSQIVRILLARAIVGRPKLLILEGDLHEISNPIREQVITNLCSDQEPWTVVIVTTDFAIKTWVPNCLTLV